MSDEERPGLFRLQVPAGRRAPVLFESPHSGRSYPPDFASCQPEAALRPAEDAFVDDLLALAPSHGIPVFAALFPRAYVDPNRRVDDLDPALLAEPWPEPLAPGPKSDLGIGLVRRVVAPGVPIYDRKLTVAEVRHRIDAYWRPYHLRLAQLIAALAKQHGRLLLVQWHSMKALGDAATPDGPGARRADVVLGDRHGRTAPVECVDRLAALFAAEGLTVARNEPYAGTEILERATTLAPNVAAVQVELNRALYLDEATTERHAGFGRLRDALDRVAAGLAA